MNLSARIKSYPTNELLKAILAELHLLRNEIKMILNEDSEPTANYSKTMVK